MLVFKHHIQHHTNYKLFLIDLLDDFLHSYSYSLFFSHTKLILDFKLALVLYGQLYKPDIMFILIMNTLSKSYTDIFSSNNARLVLLFEYLKYLHILSSHCTNKTTVCQ